MTKEKLTGKALQDVHKAVFVINEYPKKTVNDIAQLLQMSPMDINIAVWRAEDMGLLYVDKETHYAKVEMVPEKWEFGESIDYLKSQIIYYLQHLARNEADIEETYLSNLAMGYPAHDLIIAIKQLLADRVIAEYTITDTTEIKPSKKGLKRGKKPEFREDTYTFYSLWENSEQRWGEKQFKDTTKLK